MARLASYSFELNSTTNGVEFDATSGVSISSSVTRNGQYSGQNSNGGGQNRFRGQFVSGAGNGPYYVRVYFRIGTSAGAENTFLALGNNSAIPTGVAAYLTVDAGNLVRLYDNTGIIGSASTALSGNHWYRLELLFDRSGSAGSQVLRARIDGTEFAAGTTQTLGNSVFYLFLGGNIRAEGSSTGVWYFDDAAVNDSTGSFQNSYPGSGSLLMLRPAAAGDSTQWTIAGSSPAATNWQSVKETTPDDATTLVNEAVLNRSDFYTMTKAGLSAGATVNAIMVGGRFNNDVADATSAFQFQIEKATGGTVSKSASIVPNSTTWRSNGTSFAGTSPITLYQDPDGSAWTNLTVDTIQAGILAGVVGTNKVQVSDLWVLVDYIPVARQFSFF